MNLYIWIFFLTLWKQKQVFKIIIIINNEWMEGRMDGSMAGLADGLTGLFGWHRKQQIVSNQWKSVWIGLGVYKTTSNCIQFITGIYILIGNALRMDNSWCCWLARLSCPSSSIRTINSIFKLEYMTQVFKFRTPFDIVRVRVFKGVCYCVKNCSCERGKWVKGEKVELE